MGLDMPRLRLPQHGVDCCVPHDGGYAPDRQLRPSACSTAACCVVRPDPALHRGPDVRCGGVFGWEGPGGPHVRRATDGAGRAAGAAVRCPRARRTPAVMARHGRSAGRSLRRQSAARPAGIAPPPLAPRAPPFVPPVSVMPRPEERVALAFVAVVSLARVTFLVSIRVLHAQHDWRPGAFDA